MTLSVILVGLLSLALQLGSGSVIVEEYACFSQLFQVKCQEGELIVFETARYGRDDSHVAYQCGVPYQANCDVDVKFSLNRVCAGKQACNIAVNTALFGDPCGYEEFLKVKYRCVPVSSIHMACQAESASPHFDHGYLASPNYPGKYYMDAECFWRLSVQKRQTIKLTIFDFELDVRKSAKCSDYLEVSAGERVYFKECGSVGKQEIVVDASDAMVRFKTGTNSLTQRGFFIYFEAVGPGCPDLEDLHQGRIDYYIEGDVLYANASCSPGYFFRGTAALDFKQVRCAGAFWTAQVGQCLAVPPPTTPVLIETTSEKKGASSGAIDKRASIVGIALGIVSAILLITLLLMLALYFHRRRRHAERKLDLARVVINNLQDGTDIADDHYKNTLHDPPTTPSNLRGKKERRKKNNKEAYLEHGDPMAGRNLLHYTPGGAGADEEDYIMDYADCYRDFPSQEKDDYLVRKNSAGRRAAVTEGRYSEPRAASESRDELREKARARREARHRRSKSGQWEAPGSRSLLYAPVPAAAAIYSPTPKRSLTQSAPDLCQLEGCPPLPPPRPTPPRVLARSSTLSTVPAHRRAPPNHYNTLAAPARANSRAKIRC